MSDEEWNKKMRQTEKWLQMRLKNGTAREGLRQEMAMRLFMRDAMDSRCLTNAEQLEYNRLLSAESLEAAWAYLGRVAARNARRDAEVFVEAYYKGPTDA